MKLRLIYPKFKKFLEDHPSLRESLKDHVVGDYTMPPSLALPIIASLTPEDIEVNLTDDNIGEQIDFDEKVDLVVISCFTPQAQRAYKIADEFKKRGTPTIMGGIHPTAIPDECLQHCDSVCIGEVEPIWHEVLEDARAKNLKKVYQATKPYCLSEFPIPKREIFSSDKYKWNAHLVLTMRGCPVKCSGCPIPEKEGPLFRFRPVENIIKDIESMPYRQFYFTDDTVMLPGKKNMRFLLQIMERTKDLNAGIFLASTMMMVPDPQFYKKLYEGKAESIYTIFGFDSVSKNLLSPECSAEDWKKGVDLVRMIEDSGIHFFGSFGIGFDDQDEGVVDRILKFCDDARIDLAEFYIITPFPGTPFGTQVVKENRVLHRNYDLWNHSNVVFKPKNFTEQKLMESYDLLWREFYRCKTPEDTLRSFDVAT
ncbi:cobalamin-dependent protein [Chitinispirillales bacterium ANBcel5]|uniref:B12-binding domain-containing radical SAM protein n=1 Tax=Cellulosispirillum alkaliphilum TaxID=3039283 RepID=UPI002A52AA17|nr:cobalamin-dependent protein [Chitinispirillales bacterium ANBcel5]